MSDKDETKDDSDVQDGHEEEEEVSSDGTELLDRTIKEQILKYFFTLALHCVDSGNSIGNTRQLYRKKVLIMDTLDDFVDADERGDFYQQMRFISLAMCTFIEIFESLKESNGADDSSAMFDVD